MAQQTSIPMTAELASLLVGQSAQLTLSIELTPEIITALAAALMAPANAKRDKTPHVTPTLPAGIEAALATQVEDEAAETLTLAAFGLGHEPEPPQDTQDGRRDADDEPELNLADFGLGAAVDEALAAADTQAVMEQPYEGKPEPETAALDSSAAPRQTEIPDDPHAELRAQTNPAGLPGETPVWLVRVQDADGIDVAERAFASEDDATNWAVEMDAKYPEGTVYLPQRPAPLSSMYPDVEIVPASEPALSL